jgi:hypothetical protein
MVIRRRGHFGIALYLLYIFYFVHIQCWILNTYIPMTQRNKI